MSLTESRRLTIRFLPCLSSNVYCKPTRNTVITTDGVNTIQNDHHRKHSNTTTQFYIYCAKIVYASSDSQIQHKSFSLAKSTSSTRQSLSMDGGQNTFVQRMLGLLFLKVLILILYSSTVWCFQTKHLKVWPTLSVKHFHLEKILQHLLLLFTDSSQWLIVSCICYFFPNNLTVKVSISVLKRLNHTSLLAAIKFTWKAQK